MPAEPDYISGNVANSGLSTIPGYMLLWPEAAVPDNELQVALLAIDTSKLGNPIRKSSAAFGNASVGPFKPPGEKHSIHPAPQESIHRARI